MSVPNVSTPQVLHHINKTEGKERLQELFGASKVNLLLTLPESERTKEALAAALEERKLTFLVPLLGVEARLRQMHLTLLC